MDFWNILRNVADSLFSSHVSSSAAKKTTSRTSPAERPRAEKAQPRSSASQTTVAQSSPSQSAPSPKTPTDKAAKTRTPSAEKARASSNTTRTRKAPPPTSIPALEAPQLSAQEIVIGARSTIDPGTIDEAELRCRCIPKFPNTDDSDLIIDLGIDFGTRYTKICFRDSDSRRTTVVTLDYGSASLEQALIPSQLAVLEDGLILTGLTLSEWENSQWPIAETIDFIKMRLAYLDLPQEEDWLQPIKELDSPETIENLSAYFLSRLIVRSRNWIQVAYSDLFRNRPAIWVLKVGAPVEYWQGPAINRFEKVLKLAWALSYTPSIQGADMLKLPQLNRCVSRVRQWIEENPEHPFDCSAKPEIAAAVWSHIRAGGSREGFFTFFDVGEGTTEGASFRFWRDKGEDKIDFYSGFVRPLGVAALSQRMADELSMTTQEVKEQFLSWPLQYQDAVYQRLHQSICRRQLQKLVGAVVGRGCRRYRQVRPHMWRDEIGEKLGIFLGGGGGQIKFYKETISATYDDFNQQCADIRPYDLRSVPLPKDLMMRKLEAKVFDRFAIAYGLSIPDGEFPQFDFPPDNDSASQHRSRRAHDYSDTKDFC